MAYVYELDCEGRVTEPDRVVVVTPEALVVMSAVLMMLEPLELYTVPTQVTPVVSLLSNTRARKLTVVPSVVSVGSGHTTPSSCALSSYSPWDSALVCLWYGGGVENWKLY